MGIFLTSDTSFTTVAGDILTAAGEAVDGQTAAVGTTAAFGHAGLEFQVADLLIRKHTGLIAFFVALSCDQGSAEGTHDTCDIRADGFTARNLFKASKHSVIIEGTALHNYMFSKIRGVGDLDHLK